MTPSKTLVLACKKLRSRVRLETAVLYLPGNSLCTGKGDDTAAIREAQRLYIETWVVPIIDAIERGDTRFLSEFVQ